MAKPVRVKFLNDKIEKQYLSLLGNDPLKKKIDFVIARLKENPAFGQPIAKRLIPKEYKREGIDNAFWIELSKGKGWRLIYSLTSENEVEILAIILEWFTRHKDYGRKFGYE
ncbi:MAG: hypothetical protein ABIH65_02970 [Nanoarchaeota archaeon]